MERSSYLKIEREDLARPRSAARIDRRIRLFGWVLAASALMSYVPDVNLGTGLFVAAFGVFLVFSIGVGGLQLRETRPKLAALFCLYCLISLYVLSSNGYGIPEWSRAIVPFLFYLTFLLLPPLNAEERRWLGSALLVASLIWFCRTLAEAAWLVTQGSDVLSVRLTNRVVHSVLPFPLVAIPYLLFMRHGLNGLVRWGLLALFCFAYVWIGYRAGLVLMGAAFAFYIILNLRRFAIIQVASLGLIVVLLLVAGAFDSFGLVSRFDSLGAERDTSRGLEWDYVFAMFSESPIVGKGLGWQVPADIAFYRVAGLDGSEAASVGFVHSLSGYLAMDLGIIGLMLYLIMVLPRFRRWNSDDLQLFSLVALGLLLLFCNTQASFRQIQTVLLIVALLKISDFHPPALHRTRLR